MLELRNCCLNWLNLSLNHHTVVINCLLRALPAGKYPNRGYPKIFNDADVGPEAKKLFDDAQVRFCAMHPLRRTASLHNALTNT